jgi:hypothetical protein
MKKESVSIKTLLKPLKMPMPKNALRQAPTAVLNSDRGE